MHIPTLIELTEREEIPRLLILLTGNTNVGKNLYCRQFLVDRLNEGSECVYMNCTSTAEQLLEWLHGIGVARTPDSILLTHICENRVAVEIVGGAVKCLDRNKACHVKTAASQHIGTRDHRRMVRTVMVCKT